MLRSLQLSCYIALMFEAFARLHAWFASNDITKPVSVVLHTDAMTADHIGCILRDEANRMSFRLPNVEPVIAGHLYGISFKIVIEPNSPPPPKVVE